MASPRVEEPRDKPTEKHTARDLDKHPRAIASPIDEENHSLPLSIVETTEELRDKPGPRIYRFLRWNFFSVYRRIFAVVFVPNIVVLLALLLTKWIHDPNLAHSDAATAVSVNLLVATLARQEHLVNLLFFLASKIPQSAPLAIRKRVAKVYGYGGIHSGCGIAALIWYLLFAALVTRHVIIQPHTWLVISIVTHVVLILLVVIVAFAHPVIRSRMHNHFEVTHRFTGWAVIAAFWAQTVLLARLDRNDTSLGMTLLISPQLWCLFVITICISYPWASLRRRNVSAERLSEHAIRLHFDYAHVSFCMGLRLADRPLKETHAFAAIPEPGGRKGFSVVVSNAGDWTQSIIQNPPSRLWTKGVPCYGILRVATMFKPVLIVATGSGIGPCLSLFNGCPELECRVLWSAPRPFATYGRGIVDAVYAADPKAIIVDTRKQGRPDLTRMAFELYEQSGAEAVVIISNQAVTKKVVYGLETRGVPAYGPIFDS